jgi:hypothetical protein
MLEALLRHLRPKIVKTTAGCPGGVNRSEAAFSAIRDATLLSDEPGKIALG